MSRPESAAQAIEWANAGMNDGARWYVSGCGRIEMALMPDDAQSCSHPGPCDGDVLDLSRVPYVAEQLAAVDPETLRDVLREFGAWDAEQLADHAQNLQRLLWIACGDVAEGAA